MVLRICKTMGKMTGYVILPIGFGDFQNYASHFALQNYASFASQEIMEALTGIWQCIPMLLMRRGRQWGIVRSLLKSIVSLECISWTAQFFNRQAPCLVSFFRPQDVRITQQATYSPRTWIDTLLMKERRRATDFFAYFSHTLLPSFSPFDRASR